MAEFSAEAWPSATRVLVRGRELLAFCGCDYLGLSHHPLVVRAVIEEVARSGVGANGSRVTTGTSVVHERLEQYLAQLIGTQSALLTVDGTLANLIACEGLRSEFSSALIDETSHSSLKLAARAAAIDTAYYSGRDLAALAVFLGAPGAPRLLVTDGVFGASAGSAPLVDLAGLLPRGGRLLVDDSHGLGVLGPGGAGSVAAAGLGDQGGLVITASLAKAIGCSGGVVAGATSFIDSLRASSSAYRGCTAVPPATAAAALAALEVIASEPERMQRLRKHTRRVRSLFAQLGLPLPAAELPIFTITPRSALQASSLRGALAQAGVLIPLLDYPGGPSASYFRIALSSEHSAEDINQLEQLLTEHL